MTTQKDIMKEIYDAAILTAVAITISSACKKVFGTSLGLPANVKDAGKLAVAFGVSAAGVKVLEDKKLLPANPFKS